MSKIKKDNRKVVFITLAIVGLISMLVTSYSFIQTNLVGNRKYVITSGLLELTMNEKDGITLSDALPVFDEVGMLGSPYEFTLTNKSKFTLKYEMALKDETESKELLAYEDIRYGLTKDGITSFGSIADLEDMVIDTGSIETDKIISYQFRMWINHEVTDENKINGKTRTFRVTINTSKSDDDILLAATLDGEPVAEFPTVEDNYGVESITCNNDVSASFNPTTWSVTVDGLTKSNTSCIVNFSRNLTIDQTSDAITMSKSDLYAFYKGSFAGTATSSEVLSGKTVYLNGVETVGTMPNNGSVNATINAGESYTIPKGYHDGTGVITSLFSEEETPVITYKYGHPCTYTPDWTRYKKLYVLYYYGNYACIRTYNYNGTWTNHYSRWEGVWPVSVSVGSNGTLTFTGSGGDSNIHIFSIIPYN